MTVRITSFALLLLLLLAGCTQEGLIPRSETVDPGGLEGTWVNVKEDGTENWDNALYVRDDGYYYYFDNPSDTYIGGRVYAKRNKLHIRNNRSVGYLSYLSETQTYDIVELVPGETLEWVTGDGSIVKYRYYQDEHPFGGDTEMNVNNLMGRYIVYNSIQEHVEVWELKKCLRSLSSGMCLSQNHPQFFQSLNWTVEDGKLLISSPFTNYTYNIEKFVRGEGFVAGPYTLMYYDGPNRTLPANHPMPTQEELDLALQQEIAITYKANASAAQLNEAMSLFSTMMDDIADDIRGRDYRYEYPF